jgi:hypothetical protein
MEGERKMNWKGYKLAVVACFKALHRMSSGTANNRTHCRLLGNNFNPEHPRYKVRTQCNKCSGVGLCNCYCDCNIVVVWHYVVFSNICLHNRLNFIAKQIPFIYTSYVFCLLYQSHHQAKPL